MKNKSGMTVAEFLFALIICGVVLSLAISMFKAQDLVRTPFIYSIMGNLPVVNTAVQDECYKDGTCTQQKQLPTSTTEYCLRLVNNLTTSGSASCPDNIGNAQQDKFRTMDGVNYFYNFRLTSGITFFGITHTSAGNENVEWHAIPITPTGSDDNTYPNKYIDVLIDINGDNGNNAFGDDVFPIRIFQNGDVVPGYSTQENNGLAATNYFDDSEYFGYTVWLNTYANDSLKSYGVDLRTNQERADDSTNSFTKYDKVGFRRAVCTAFSEDKAKDVLKRYYGNMNNSNDNWCQITIDDNAINVTQSPNCACADEVSATPDGNNSPTCTNNNSVFTDIKTAHCTIENAKPRGSGLLQLIGF